MMLNVVLVEPEIPPNTGNIGRLCLATESKLHLVGPLGFSLDDKSLKRAGLDYWSDVDVTSWSSFEELQTKAGPDAQFYFLTTKSDKPYWEVNFKPNDYIVFGSETRGLPESMLDRFRERVLTIPQKSGRSLNLATAVGVVMYEVVRQVNVCE